MVLFHKVLVSNSRHEGWGLGNQMQRALVMLTLAAVAALIVLSIANRRAIEAAWWRSVLRDPQTHGTSRSTHAARRLTELDDKSAVPILREAFQKKVASGEWPAEFAICLARLGGPEVAPDLAAALAQAKWREGVFPGNFSRYVAELIDSLAELDPEAAAAALPAAIAELTADRSGGAF